MKEDFAMTKNVQRFMSGVEVLETPIRGRIGLMISIGPPGTGKTEVGLWYAALNNLPYIRAKDITSRRSLLANIAAELGEAPLYRSDDLFNQIIEQLIEHPRVMIIDEIDYLVRGGAIEVLRDINDMTNSPIVLMGMEHADKKLKRFRHLFDRVTAFVRFELFTEQEIAELAQQICEVPISDCGVTFIRAQGQGKLRMTTMWFARAERLAQHNQLDLVTGEHLRAYRG